MTDYYIKNGNFTRQNNQMIFNGKTKEYVNSETQEKSVITSAGIILFPNNFKEGIISYDITLSDVNPKTNFGIITDYKNIDGKETYYQTEIRNDGSGYSLYFWDGSSWEYKLAGGTSNTLKNQKYHLKLELRGNVQKLFINNVLLYTYTGMMNIQGAAGIYIRHAFQATLENIYTETKEPTVFTIMKFEKDFDDLYNEVIAPQFRAYGYNPIRADECYTSTSIIQDIVHEIRDASIIIADITMDNPNVFYELGYAHALNKPTILLADVDKRERLPFDVSGFRTIFYTNSIGGKKEIETVLNKYIENINR